MHDLRVCSRDRRENAFLDYRIVDRGLVKGNPNRAREILQEGTEPEFLQKVAKAAKESRRND
jgi:hypothetical protein